MNRDTLIIFIITILILAFVFVGTISELNEIQNKLDECQSDGWFGVEFKEQGWKKVFSNEVVCANKDTKISVGEKEK